jgi:hypothetical protein
MATFRVGQRVRVSLPGSVNHGKECRITGEPDYYLIHTGPGAGRVRFVYVTSLLGLSGRACGYTHDELIPLADPGHTEISIESMLSIPGLESLESVFLTVRSNA